MSRTVQFDPHQFVDSLYKIILGREADTSGLDNYVAALQSGRRMPQEVVADLLGSDERKRIERAGPGEGDRKGVVRVGHEPFEAPPGAVAKDALHRTIQIRDLPSTCFRSDSARRISGTITYPVEEEHRLPRISIGHHGSPPENVVNVTVHLESIPHLFLDIANANHSVSFGKQVQGPWVFHLWGNCAIEIGDDVTSNGMDIYVDPGGRLKIGDDCMFANGYIHVGDNHALFDVASGKTLNVRSHPQVLIGSHVWMASRATILSDSRIGDGSAIAAGAVVKGDFPACTLLGGVPARLIKHGVSWTRSYDGQGREAIQNMLSTAFAEQV